MAEADGCPAARARYVRLMRVQGSVLAVLVSVGGCHGSVVGDAVDSATDGTPSDVGDVRADRAALDSNLPPGVVRDGDGCPTNRGPGMVKVDTFCIDATEVTEVQFRAFLDVVDKPTVLQCGSIAYRAGVAPTMMPATNVTWCEAAAFCAWSGKRLCGRRGGGSSSSGTLADPTLDQWSFACHGGETTTVYPYGDSYDRDRCAGVEQSAGSKLYPVNLLGTKCRSSIPPFNRVIDLSGNAAEWEDACDSDEPAAYCHARGGSYLSNSSEMTCASTTFYARNVGVPEVGFRCCADLP